MSALSTVHQLYIQAILSRRCTKESTAVKVFKRCCEILDSASLREYNAKYTSH
jgi:hypothetical protein